MERGGEGDGSKLVRGLRCGEVFICWTKLVHRLRCGNVFIFWSKLVHRLRCAADKYTAIRLDKFLAACAQIAPRESIHLLES